MKEFKKYITNKDKVTEAEFNNLLSLCQKNLDNPYDYFDNTYEEFINTGYFWVDTRVEKNEDSYRYGVDNNSQHAEPTSYSDLVQLLSSDEVKDDEEDDYDYTTHGDFQRLWCKTQKRNYWLLGYFGGGSISVVDAYKLGKQFATANNVKLSTVRIDEIFKSRRYKSFKFMFSSEPNQKPEPNARQLDNFWVAVSD